MVVDPRIPDALDTFLTRLRADLDAHGAALTAAVLEHSQQGEEDWRAQIEQLEARLAAVEAEARRARVEVVTGLLRAVRRLDDAASLSAILEALAKGAVAEAERVAVLIVEPDVFRIWGHFGFAEGEEPTQTPVGHVSLLKAAVSTQQISIVSAADGETIPDLPAFMRPPAGHAGLIAPLTLAGEVVAILYAEGTERRSEQDEAALWAEEVELLVRHAAGRLENVTSERTVAALTRTV